MKIFTTLLLFLSQAVLWANEAERVVIVANSNDASSLELAEYYAEARGIPVKNIIRLDAPLGETITVEEYVKHIYNPLLGALIEAEWVKGARSGVADSIGRRRMSIGLHSMSYLVLMRGVPLRIANDPEKLEAGTEGLQEVLRVNRGSVDSELAVMVVPGRLPLASLLKNPLFENKTPTTQELGTFLRVSRLDGPTVGDVKRLIDRSLEAERTGLRGRAYMDSGGPHKTGDEWILAAGALAEGAYFDTDYETSKRVLDQRDRLDLPAIYMGWYREHAYGPWREKRWDVPPGAIGFHLHSFSAVTVRSASKAWVGPLVAQGYCATVGNVYEPYLEFTHRPQHLLEQLLSGRTFGEAVVYSCPVASWMGIAVGDPLYRPFAVNLEQQLAEIGANPDGSYVVLREINRLEQQAGAAEAVSFGRAHFMERPTLPLAYRLAVLYEAEGDVSKAREVLGVIRYIDHFSKEERVLVKGIADALSRYGDDELAFGVYRKLLSESGLEKALRLQLLEKGSQLAMSANEVNLASRWTMEARKLKQPPAAKANVK